MNFVVNDEDLDQAIMLAELVRTLNLSGHNPATSGNYSLRSRALNGYALMSESGIDKARFTKENLLPIDIRTRQFHPDFTGLKRKPSDETAIHLRIYQETTANCVLHSHMLDSLLFANLYPNQKTIIMEGLELLKGFQGIVTHESQVIIPCFENTQDIDKLALELKDQLGSNNPIFGLLLRHHGLYVWGESVAIAKRHLEVFEYLFKYYLQSHALKLRI